MLWDEKNKRIRIIDTDFFIKSNDITEQESYNNNIQDFYSELQMELGLLNGQDSVLRSFLQDNVEYSEIENKLLLESLFGEEHTVSATDLIKKTVEIFEQRFNIHAKTFQDMEQVLVNRSFKGKREQFINGLSFGNDDDNMAKLEDFINNLTTKSKNQIEHDEK